LNQQLKSAVIDAHTPNTPEIPHPLGFIEAIKLTDKGTNVTAIAVITARETFGGAPYSKRVTSSTKRAPLNSFIRKTLSSPFELTNSCMTFRYVEG
jgi:hypothetical protein